MTHSTYIHYKNTSNCAFQSENPGYPFGGNAAYVTGREYEGGFWVRFSFIIWVLVRWCSVCENLGYIFMIYVFFYMGIIL